MATEPVDILQRMIADVRKRVDKIDERLTSLDRIEAKVDDLAYITNNIVGLVGTNHLRMERLNEEIRSLAARIIRLEERV